LTIGALGIPDAKLGDRTHFASDPTRKNLSSLLFAEPRTMEIAFANKGHYISDQVMLVENSVNYYGHNGC
jgi:hypothetical protein